MDGRLVLRGVLLLLQVIGAYLLRASLQSRHNFEVERKSERTA
jgi:hypothetical protein